MSNVSSYRSVVGRSEGLYKDRGSKFIGYVFPVSSEDVVSTYLEMIAREHPKARHLCYAYRLNPAGDLFRSNDDGEPSGTAGKPILNQIDAFTITNVLVIVVRYFGGKLLGVSGLIQAYKLCAQSALSHATIQEHLVKSRYILHFDYAIMGRLLDALSKFEVAIIERRLDATPQIVFEVPLQSDQQRLDQIIASTLSLPLDMVAGKRMFDQLSIEPLVP
ncbi:MAG: YigZ family protein [Saprospiraceae bacterium]|nr:YigZ family protein [Saprospiraceae bacterium]